MIILDTNVLSELMRAQAEPPVVDWLDRQEQDSLAVTAVTVAELLYGIARLPEGRRKTGYGMPRCRCWMRNSRAECLRSTRMPPSITPRSSPSANALVVRLAWRTRRLQPYADTTLPTGVTPRTSTVSTSSLPTLGWIEMVIKRPRCQASPERFERAWACLSSAWSSNHQSERHFT